MFNPTSQPASTALNPYGISNGDRYNPGHFHVPGLNPSLNPR